MLFVPAGMDLMSLQKNEFLYSLFYNLRSIFDKLGLFAAQQHNIWYDLPNKNENKL